MKIVTAKLKSLSPYSQSQVVKEPKKQKEGADQFELRTWHHHLHLQDGLVVVPPMAFSNCIAEAAKYLSIQIPGRGKSTYTKHFEAGILVSEAIPLIHPDTQENILPPSELGLVAAQAAYPIGGVEIDADIQKQLDAWTKPVNEVDPDWIFTSANGSGSGTRVWRCYPVITKWEATLNVLVLDDVITESVFRDVLKQAGMLIGIGRWRVRNRGMYGRFAIESLEWKEYEG